MIVAFELSPPSYGRYYRCYNNGVCVGFIQPERLGGGRLGLRPRGGRGGGGPRQEEAHAATLQQAGPALQREERKGKTTPNVTTTICVRF